MIGVKLILHNFNGFIPYECEESELFFEVPGNNILITITVHLTQENLN